MLRQHVEDVPDTSSSNLLLNCQCQGSCGLPWLLAVLHEFPNNSFFFISRKSSPQLKQSQQGEQLPQYHTSDLHSSCDLLWPPGLILQYFCCFYSCAFLNISFCLHHYWVLFWAVSPVSPEHFYLRPSLQVLSVLPGKKVIAKWYKYILQSVPLDANKNIQPSQADSKSPWGLIWIMLR